MASFGGHIGASVPFTAHIASKVNIKVKANTTGHKRSPASGHWQGFFFLPPDSPHDDSGGRVLADQSACLRRKAGISRSSMPPDDSASTRAAAWVRLVRQTLGTDMLP